MAPGEATRWEIELAPLEPRALTVLFDVSNKCNLRCRFCYFSYDSVFHRRATYMPLETFERIAETLLPLAHTVYLSAGSESLTHPRFAEIVRCAGRYRPGELKLLTNGLLLDDEIGAALIDARATQVHFSVDGATRPTYEHLRRGGSFEVLKARIAAFARLKRERGSSLPRLQFNVILMRRNLDELEQFVDLALELGVEQIACRPLMPYEGLEMEAESTTLEPRCANQRYASFLGYATRRGVRITNFPEFYSIDGQAWEPPTTAQPSGAGAGPIGALDAPPEASVRTHGAVELAGWALDSGGLPRVEIRCVDRLASTHVGWATRRNALRPDVTECYPALPASYRAGWTFELPQTLLPPGTGPRARFAVLAHAAGGRSTVLGERLVEFLPKGTARPLLFCRKPFDNVYVDALANVYPYPDCQTVDPFGSLAKQQSFRDIWYGTEFQDLRRRIAEREPPRMCLTCPDFINRRVDDPVFFRERPIERTFRKPIGYLDAPSSSAADGASLAIWGWALGHAPVQRIEVLRLPHGQESSERPDGMILVAATEPATEARPDVARLYGHVPGHERAGWRASLALDRFPANGRFELRVDAVNSEGQRTELGRMALELGEQVCGALDRPQGVFEARGERLDAVGWALATSGRPQVSAELVLEGGARRRIAVARPHRKRRPDVAAHFPAFPGAERAGWKLSLERAAFAPRARHVVEFVARGPRGTAQVLGRLDLCFAPAGPRSVEATP